MALNDDDTEWRARLAADDARSIRAAAMEKRFPRRALEAARAADEQAPAIVKLRTWAATHRDGIAVLAGAPGIGKTVAATWWAERQPAIPQFVRAATLATSSRYDDSRATWTRAAALVLDDLGAEHADAKGAFTADIDELVDRFYADRRTLVITTNLAAAAFAARYGERVVDRVREAGAWLAIAAGSLRGRGDV